MTDRTGTCAVCGEPFPLTKTWRKYCSVKCGRKGAPSAAMVTVTCCICGESMQQRERYVDRRNPICSEVCSSELKRRNLAAPRSELPADHPARWILGQWSSPLRYYECIDCGSLACYDARYASARRCKWCRSDPHKYARFIVGFCSQCGESFVRDRMQCSNLQKSGDVYCSHRCSRKAHKTKRKARKRQGFVEHVSRHYIFERDGYCCQICGKKLAMSKAVPHPKAPTLDHIIPIAQGGTHERSNVQAAHFICNALKSDGSAADQLLLLG